MVLFWILFVIVFLPIAIIAPTKVVFKHKVDKSKNYIVVCNHLSSFDPILLDLHLKRRIRFISKKELWKGKKKSFLFDTILGCIPVDRTKGLELSTTKKVLKLLEQKEWLGIFPEGTRKHEEQSALKHGACMFAIKSRTPILPCYLLNKFKPFRKNVLIIGEPFEMEEFYNKKLDKNLLEEASTFLQNKLFELKTDYKKNIDKNNIDK